jgi:hypothetical protein
LAVQFFKFIRRLDLSIHQQNFNPNPELHSNLFGSMRAIAAIVLAAAILADAAPSLGRRRLHEDRNDPTEFKSQCVIEYVTVAWKPETTGDGNRKQHHHHDKSANEPSATISEDITTSLSAVPAFTKSATASKSKASEIKVKAKDSSKSTTTSEDNTPSISVIPTFVKSTIAPKSKSSEAIVEAKGVSKSTTTSEDSVTSISVASASPESTTSSKPAPSLAPVATQPTGKYSRVVAFGDNLSDNGNGKPQTNQLHMHNANLT